MMALFLLPISSSDNGSSLLKFNHEKTMVSLVGSLFVVTGCKIKKEEQFVEKETHPFQLPLSARRHLS